MPYRVVAIDPTDDNPHHAVGDIIPDNHVLRRGGHNNAFMLIGPPDCESKGYHTRTFAKVEPLSVAPIGEQLRRRRGRQVHPVAEKAPKEWQPWRTSAETRKATPIGRFLKYYFPDAIAELARLSLVANNQHNPGEPMHWARGKSTDHEDCVIKHFLDSGKFDDDGQLHSAKEAWRSLAKLQLEIEQLTKEFEGK